MKYLGTSVVIIYHFCVCVFVCLKMCQNARLVGILVPLVRLHFDGVDRVGAPPRGAVLKGPTKPTRTLLADPGLLRVWCRVCVSTERTRQVRQKTARTEQALSWVHRQRRGHEKKKQHERFTTTSKRSSKRTRKPGGREDRACDGCSPGTCADG